MKEADRQLALAENLNALGIVLYYGSDERLRDTRVLNPNWAANGLYAIVRGVNKLPHKDVKDKDVKGQLWAGDFDKVLAKGLEGMNVERGAALKDYPREKNGVKVHEFLLELMLDRELGFLASEEHGKDLYILPGLLDGDEPEPKDFDIAAHIDGAAVTFRYLYDLLPSGVMSRFIVRTHPLSKGYFRWKRGVVLGWGGARAVVLAEQHRNPRLDMYIKGGTPDERQQLAGIIRSNLDEIHKGLPEALRGEQQIATDAGEYVSVDKLATLEAEHKPLQLVTSSGSKELAVTPELEKLQPLSAREPGAPALRLFVSYAHKDLRMWEDLKTHLDVLKNEGLVSWWFDGKIRHGEEWDEIIRKELNGADIVILMLSPAFFASKYIQGVEMQEARRMQQTGTTQILPVLLKPDGGAFSNHPWLKTLQSAPTVHGKLRPLSSFVPRVNGWTKVQEALRGMIAGVVQKHAGQGRNRRI
jgi:hypothetical protein